MTTLFELDDFIETLPPWRIVPDWERCGLCGVKCSWNQGGTRVGGAICDGCAYVDRCRLDESRGMYISHWGCVHTLADHDELVAAQLRRRAKYLASQSPISEAGA